MRVVIALTFLLAACASPAFSPRVQSYTGPVKPFETTWVANTPEIINQACQTILKDKADYHTVGCAFWADNTCTIFTPVPQSEDDYNVVHHEVGHCVAGDWHTK